MTPAKVKKVRAFLKKQHSDLIAVKTRHIRKAVAKSKPIKAKLSKKIDAWSNGDKFDMMSGKAAKKWATSTAIALSSIVRDGIEGASGEASRLAVEHLNRLNDLVSDHFDDDPMEIDESAGEYDDEDRLDELQVKYVGNSKFGALATLMKVASAVTTGLSLLEFADSIKADSDDPDDIADSLFGSIDSRTETYIRTETGRAYGAAMDEAAEGAEQKRWATIDPGCEHICHPADGQTVDMDDLFELGNDDMVDYPPAHPNCDCTWLPWKEDWGNTRSTDDIEEAA